MHGEIAQLLVLKSDVSRESGESLDVDGVCRAVEDYADTGSAGAKREGDEGAGEASWGDESIPPNVWSTRATRSGT